MNILGMIGLMAQVKEASVAGENQSIITLMMQTSFIMQLTLLLLFIFMGVSWAIIGSKYFQLKGAKQRSRKFFQMFWHAKTIEVLADKGGSHKGPAFNVFKVGTEALNKKPSPSGRFDVEREVRRATKVEITRMEHGVPFLATTGSVAPFVGLFGTVWGILNAFWAISKTGATSLAIVGPQIAGALVTTALGLAAAIPAVIFYNFYVNQLRMISKDLWDFTDDYLDRINKEF